MKRLWDALRGVVFWIGPFTLPAAAAWYLYACYDSLPDRFPIHWAHNGKPDQWAEKSVQGVFYGPVIGGLVMIFAALAELLILAADRAAPVQLNPVDRSRRKRRIGWLNWLLGLTFGVLSVLPGVAPEDFLLPAWVMATVAFVFVVLSLFATLKVKR
jgi:uncharacterized membrane protein